MRPGGESGVEAVGQCVGRNVGIGGIGRERKRVAFGYRLLGDIGQYRWLIRVRGDDGVGLIGEIARQIGCPDRDRLGRTLGRRRRPGDDARRRIDGHAVRRLGKGVANGVGGLRVVRIGHALDRRGDGHRSERGRPGIDGNCELLGSIANQVHRIVPIADVHGQVA